MIELVDIKLVEYLNDIYATNFLYCIDETADFAKFKEISEKKGFELDLPLGALGREPSTYNRERFNMQAKRLGQPHFARVNQDATIGSTTRFIPIDLTYKIRLYTYKFAEAIDFERATWFDLQDALLPVIYPVYNSEATYKLPIIVEQVTVPEETQVFRRSRTYKTTIDITVQGWVVEIKDVRLIHEVYSNILDIDSTVLEEFYAGQRLWE